MDAAIFYKSCLIRTKITKIFNKLETVKEKTIKKLFQCSKEELIYNVGEWPGMGFELDHICPCSQAETMEELLKLQHYSNLRWITRQENRRKRSFRTKEGEQLCLLLLGREFKDCNINVKSNEAENGKGFTLDEKSV